MSYNLVDPTTGDLTQVAGRGRAEYGASTVRQGAITIPGQNPQTYQTVSVTFDMPMPDADYHVVFKNRYGSGDVINIEWQTKNGFTFTVFNVGGASGTHSADYFAFKLYSDVEYSNIVNSMPSNASASNKLVTASDNNFTYKKLAANTDFNTLITPGLYAVGTDNVSVSHAPIVGTFSVIVSNVADGWVQQLAIFNGDGRTFVRISIPGNWGIWDEVSFLNKVVQKFDTDITPTVGVTGLYNTVVDCATQLVTVLKAKGQGSWSGLVTYSGSWSGQYLSLVYNALCVVTGTFRYNNGIYNFYAVHNGTDLKINTDAQQDITVTTNSNFISGTINVRKVGRIVEVSGSATLKTSTDGSRLVFATGFPTPTASVSSTPSWGGTTLGKVFFLNTDGSIGIWGGAGEEAVAQFDFVYIATDN